MTTYYFRDPEEALKRAKAVGNPPAFLDENNLPGIGKWIEENGLGVNMGYLAASGFCRYPLYTLF